jgi:hypothetical protein
VASESGDYAKAQSSGGWLAATGLGRRRGAARRELIRKVTADWRGMR